MLETNQTNETRWERAWPSKWPYKSASKSARISSPAHNGRRGDSVVDFKVGWSIRKWPWWQSKLGYFQVGFQDTCHSSIDSTADGWRWRWDSATNQSTTAINYSSPALISAIKRARNIEANRHRSGINHRLGTSFTWAAQFSRIEFKITDKNPKNAIIMINFELIVSISCRNRNGNYHPFHSIGSELTNNSVIFIEISFLFFSKDNSNINNTNK